MATRGKKEVIEQAAMELFATRGPAGATIKDIAARSGVTEGALYRHYASKESLATALFVRELAKLREDLLRVIESDAPLPSKLKGLISRIYLRYEEDPFALLFILLNFQNMQGLDLPGETGNIYDFITERTAQILAGMPGGDTSEITPVLLAGIIMEPVLFHHYGRLSLLPSAYIHEVTAACCRLLGVEHEG